MMMMMMVKFVLMVLPATVVRGAEGASGSATATASPAATTSALGMVLDTATCDSFTTPSDAYWDAVLACPQCTLKGCGYCKTSLRVCQWRVLYY